MAAIFKTMVSRMQIRWQLLIGMALVVVLTSLAFTFLLLSAKRLAVIHEANAKLLMAAMAERAMLGPQYFNQIVDRHSVSAERFAEIVANNDECCRKLNLQYLWSVMVQDGSIVFTSATHSDLAVSNSACASFFEAHTDPAAFDETLRTRQITFSTFRNKWGAGRMVLVPETDQLGRLHIFGASMQVDEFRTLIARTVKTVGGLCGGVMLIALLVTWWLAQSISKPIVQLTQAAKRMSPSDFSQSLLSAGSEELVTLAGSLETMRQTVKAQLVSIRQLNEELEQRVSERTSQLEAANKELESFSYSVSHDLRSPLRALAGFSQILQEDYGETLPDEAISHLKHIQQSARQMEQFINDLLLFSQFSRKPLNKKSVSMSALVREALASLAAERAGRQIEVAVGDLPVCEVDPSLFSHVWINLLSNAIKFTRPREVARIEVGTLIPPESTHPKQVVYFIKDNGVGFDMNYAGQLFGVFQRMHAADEFEGTGVGLSIVQRIIQRHGGRIWVESQLDHGSTFFFTLD